MFCGASASMPRSNTSFLYLPDDIPRCLLKGD